MCNLFAQIMIIFGTSVLSFGQQMRKVDNAWKDGRATFYGHEYQTWSIHEGSCGFGYLCGEEGTGWDVASISSSHENFVSSCGRCYEVKCSSSDDDACRDLRGDTSLVVTVTDWCLCSSVQSMYSNHRWCCDDVAHFHLSVWAFEKIAHTKQGVIGLQYREVPCNYIPPKRARPVENPPPPNPVPPHTYCPQSNFPLRQQIINSNHIDPISSIVENQLEHQQIFDNLQQEYKENSVKISDDYKDTFSVLFGIQQQSLNSSLQQIQNLNSSNFVLNSSSLNFEYLHLGQQNSSYLDNKFPVRTFQKFSNDKQNEYLSNSNQDFLQMHAYQLQSMQQKLYNQSDEIYNYKIINESLFLQNSDENFNIQYINTTTCNNTIQIILYKS
eukprot:TRINITY_DN3067_c0_g1_i1.p1 TRINITY_DN3067_c0_g1~~TRINITY_DN3067_c0_g1_i1.p1  ORF type:complete len:384 (+),score=37.32 TRINITY_DN3067_c0_g1_i1:229-1380(+)